MRNHDEDLDLEDDGGFDDDDVDDLFGEDADARSAGIDDDFDDDADWA
jgi:hypothetical protein